MGKHNGRARKAGLQVGHALVNNRKKGRFGAPADTIIAGNHTTDIRAPAPNNQSVLERSDLEELMAMADLAERDFTAERTHAVVVSTNAMDALSEQRDAEERAAAEARHAHRLRIPRRPEWDENTTPEQLDHQERTSFLDWRRGLALLEQEEKLVLTPFEKNLEVWRQLWRVLERSDIVVQVVDARDPLLYWSDDLAAYARDVHESKASLVLLNKADLMPLAVRQRWARHMQQAGIDYAFWSAAAMMEEQQALRAEATELGMDVHELREKRQRQRRRQRAAAAAAQAQQAAQQQGGASEDASEDLRTDILDADELLELLEQRARDAIKAAGPSDPRAADPDRRLMIGLVGYPNVGKSSTINAIFGSKKTAVAPTPGKTKHFQTLNVSPTMVLCDCPGLVMPRFARSKAEMVAAGVVPIDRLTDIRGPVEVVAGRAGRPQLEAVYGIKLPPPQMHEAPMAPPTAAQLLRAFALLRGWTVGSGLPDESRAGRFVLRDYTAGRLLHCVLPPDSDPASYTPLLQDPETLALLYPSAPAAAEVPAAAPAAEASGSGQQQAAAQGEAGSDDEEQEAADEAAAAAGAAAGSSSIPVFDDADLDLLADLSFAGDGKGPKAKRAEHKFQKKAARTKGTRGQIRAEGAGDGLGMTTGKKGGLVRVGGY